MIEGLEKVENVICQQSMAAPATVNKIGNLPPLIKINAADVNMNMDTAMIDGAMEKAKTAGKNISLNSGEIACSRSWNRASPTIETR
jgi:hypothetical protein